MNWYDMNLRMYDPALARWMVQDPVIHYNKSPYNAFDNNPVYFADPSGADTEGGGDTPDPKLAFGVPYSSIARTSAIETTIQGKSTTNVILNFTYTDTEGGEFDKKSWGKSGYNVYNVDNTDEALESIKGLKINNLLLITHGGTIPSTGEYRVYLSSDKESILNNWVIDSDIYAYENGTIRNIVVNNNIENLISLGSNIENGKNYVFQSCNAAWGGSTIADFLSRNIGNNIDVFMNGDRTTLKYGTISNKVETNGNIGRDLTIPKYQSKGWIKSNEGQSTNIKNLQINENGVKVVK
ncbi:hypothetical protein E4J94_16730 [Empedobacter tilapiae]|uniref:RHS repeat-associated core domain-containing protein n=1 Tax=Empedobacter tilapiae TaxID=2491114 RepID=A0A4Z1AXL6_9FLAO|nr:hypothetical protein E4J94_16730 [Empedobacter tilapiae]